MTAMRNKNQWPEGADKILTDLRARGLSAGQISAALKNSGYDFSRGAVQGRSKRLAIASKNRRDDSTDFAPVKPRRAASAWPEAAMAILLEQRENGASASQISAALSRAGFDFSRNAVQGRCARLGLPSHNRAEDSALFAPPNRKVAAKPPPPPPVRPIGDRSLKWLGERGRGECAYPMGRDEQGRITFCCEPVRGEGHSYCAECYKITHQERPLRKARPPKFAYQAGSPDRLFGGVL